MENIINTSYNNIFSYTITKTQAHTHKHLKILFQTEKEREEDRNILGFNNVFMDCFYLHSIQSEEISDGISFLKVVP